MNFKKIAIAFAAALLGLYLIGFLIPNHYRVVREASIVAAPKMVFAFVGDLSRWHEWTTWAKMDPHMQQVVSNPSYGVSANQTWKSEKMGEGHVEVTQWVADDVISYDLHFGDFPPSHASMHMTSLPQGAKVTWTFEGAVGSGSLQRWFGVLMRYFIGRDLTQSLENLRKLCESSVASEVKSPWHEQPADLNATSKSPKGNAKSAPSEAKASTANKHPAHPGMKPGEPPAVLPMPGAPKPVPPKAK